MLMVVKHVPWVLVFRVGRMTSQWLSRNAAVLSSMKKTGEMED